jgi:hypothetical protein
MKNGDSLYPSDTSSVHSLQEVANGLTIVMGLHGLNVPMRWRANVLPSRELPRHLEEVRTFLMVMDNLLFLGFPFTKSLIKGTQTLFSV